MRIIFLVFITIFFTSCAQQNIRNIDVNKNAKFNQIQTIPTFDVCTNDSYIATLNDKKYGRLFIEYISLNNNCLWNGYQRGYFMYQFQNKLNIKDMKAVEDFNFDNYEITTYLVDHKYYVNLIYKYGVFEDEFILDYSGVMSSEIIRKYDSSYVSEYQDKGRFNRDYNYSLVRENLINSYFVRELEEYSK
ncbi:hypothetical protein [Poseidonibacter lekithochrous]|uniref:hypothetical protein n=1 Tax=Poseidonibacter lekithochrous TaxID=1904463 RepID=UPI0008FC73DA|nr:hypothetical protein [Poseidonibacter lekithochrous]QKJ21696.1 hypothetical protein ALEK_0393 [Poseidonibacter lekithochrous]